MRISSDDRLLLDVVEGLRGADDLRSRLLATLQTGTPAVADLAYAVKARVKEDYKTVDKIKDRRVGKPPEVKPDPTYSIRDVTDLVGLRIITLYRLDAIEVIRTLLDTIAGDTSPTAPFVPGSVFEVKIYSTNATGDVQELPQRLRRLFGEYGLDHLVKVAEKPTNYSSIHILVRGRGKYKDGYRTLPIEIQVRTALEDVWGQIEHSLRYKRKKLTGVGEASRESAQLQTTLSHLGALKTMIDGIAQYGDQIKLQIDELEPTLRYSNVRAAEETSVRLGKLTDLPPEIRNEVDAATAASKPAMAAAYGTAEERSRTLRLSLSRLELVSQDLAATPDLRTKTREEAGFVIDMQRALIHFQLGNLSSGGGNQLQKALTLYTDLERRFPKRLVVGYRLSQTLDALGARSEAVSKLRQLIEQLDANLEPTPLDHWIRAAVPRLLGVLLWEEAKAGGGGDMQDGQAASSGGVLMLLKEAYEFTRTAYALKVSEEGGKDQAAAEHDKAANNLLYFLLEYLEAGGAARADMERSDVERLLTEIGGHDPGAITHLDVADTARRAHLFLGNAPAAVEAARAVLRLSAGPAPGRSAFVREAIRAAQRLLDETEARGSVEPGAIRLEEAVAQRRHDAAGGASSPQARSRRRRRKSPAEDDATN